MTEAGVDEERSTARSSWSTRRARPRRPGRPRRREARRRPARRGGRTPGARGRRRRPRLARGRRRAIRPTILIGVTAVAGTFSEAVVRATADGAVRPIILPLSNPTANSEATPADVLRWTDGRALVATGSPFPPVTLPSGHREVAQANNVFVFPGLGLGAMVAEARAITDGMLLAAGRALAGAVTEDRLVAGQLLPSIGALRAISRWVAIAVATEARHAGVAGLADDRDIAAEVDAATWWPAYVPYTRGRSADAGAPPPLGRLSARARRRPPSLSPRRSPGSRASAGARRARRR